MIRKLSKKRAKQNREYSTLRKQFLELNPNCRVCGIEATDIHHKKGRTGHLLTDIRFFLPVCRRCHQRIELNPSWAKEKGYSLSRLAI